MLLVKVPWADRVMALPFLTLLAPSKRFYADKARAPKTLLDWAAERAPGAAPPDLPSVASIDFTKAIITRANSTATAGVRSPRA
jgi:hypothetical protein